ncbi:armadillo repeat-containing protein 1-like [Cimex lectularius]|uniref:Armadillo repeat-containing protein 1 n=1 Tax=Cimex lectularius TaxID=79782 RepID=A0A8I6RHT0_CIMLE|nr:armadillo repeat-containing protein 1-like [Cimex lectularius]
MTEESEKTSESESESDTIAQTLASYNKLALDETKHTTLVKDKTMVQFLAYCLDSNDNNALELSLRTLDLLAQNPKNRQEMSSTFGVLEALKATYERDIPEDLRKLAKNVKTILETPVTQDSFNQPARPSLLGDHNYSKKFSSIVFSFHVFGLNNDSRDNLESALVRVRGVISVVVYPDHQRCIVRVIERITAEMLAEAILDKAGLIAHLVVKNKNNQEVLKDILGKKKIQTLNLGGRGDLSPIAEYIEDAEEKNLSDDELPPYLPEEESPVKEKALHPFDRFRTSAASWVKTATSLFQNSFYW